MADPLVVRTPGGDVRGRHHGGTRAFLGIPYAAPPLGRNRWRAPQPAQPWSGTRDATEPPPAACQVLPVVDMAIGVEDCLYLNVFAPAEPPAEPAPVMVWIHGGGFTVGSSNDDDPSRIVERCGVVAVSLNYRLGPFGFLAHPALVDEDPTGAAGNMGLLDQVAALEWVRASIAAFGGDPGNVTIFGESAGGMSVADHLLSPKSAGLFHRAVVQSAPLHKGISRERALRQGEELARVLGCDGRADPIAAMREIDAADVLAAMPPDLTFIFHRASTWMPVSDGTVIPEDPVEAIRDGELNRVPVLTGITRDEGRLFVGMAAHTVGARDEPVTERGYADRVCGFFGTEVGAGVLEHYPLADYPDPGAAFGQAVGDAVISHPALDGAADMARHLPVHLYQYEHEPNPFILPMEGIDLGAFHAAELPYVFGGPVISSGPFEFSPAEAELSEAVMDAWGRFAATGDPAGPSLPWPETGAAGAYVALDTPLGAGEGCKAGLRAFWREAGWDPDSAGSQGAVERRSR